MYGVGMYGGGGPKDKSTRTECQVSERRRAIVSFPLPFNPNLPQPPLTQRSPVPPARLSLVPHAPHGPMQEFKSLSTYLQRRVAWGGPNRGAYFTLFSPINRINIKRLHICAQCTGRASTTGRARENHVVSNATATRLVCAWPYVAGEVA